MRDAVHRAGFQLIAARSLDEAWGKTDFFDFGCVVIDYDLKNDVAASALRQRFIALNLNEEATPEALSIELSSLFNRSSELVQ